MFSRILTISKDRSFFLFGARGTGKSTYLDSLVDKDELLINKLDLLEFKTERVFFENPDELSSRIDGASEKQKQTEIPSQDSPKKWVYIDEVQKNPKLLDIVQKQIKKVKFALSGSSARKLKRGGANLLAGRATQYYLFPLTFKELDDYFNLEEVLRWGSLPEIFELKNEESKQDFLDSYVTTYLREEVIQEQLIRQVRPFRLFLDIAGQINGEQISFAKIARQVSVDDQTIKTYFEILEDTLLGFFLWPLQSSIRKKITQSPKFYLFDLGIKRALSNRINTLIAPSTEEYGRAFEHLFILECYRLNSYLKTKFEFYYLRTGSGVEIDLIIEKPNKDKIFIEIKSTTHVTEDHITSISGFAKDIEDNDKLVCVSNDVTRKIIAEVSCVYWREFLDELYYAK